MFVVVGRERPWRPRDGDEDFGEGDETEPLREPVLGMIEAERAVSEECHIVVSFTSLGVKDSLLRYRVSLSLLFVLVGCRSVLSYELL